MMSYLMTSCYDIITLKKSPNNFSVAAEKDNCCVSKWINKQVTMMMKMLYLELQSEVE